MSDQIKTAIVLTFVVTFIKLSKAGTIISRNLITTKIGKALLSRSEDAESNHLQISLSSLREQHSITNSQTNFRYKTNAPF